MIITSPSLSAVQVLTPEQRRDALRVLSATYRREKGWIADEEHVFPESDLRNGEISWFLVYADGEPAGVIRVLYDPDPRDYHRYRMQFLSPGVDVGVLLSSNCLDEVGRFAVLGQYRRNIGIVALLIKASSEDTVRRGYKYYITDVFEGEQHSPFKFHTRVFGFKPIATHESGEVSCRNRRITLLLNLAEAYQRLRIGKTRLYRSLTAGWDESLHRNIVTEENRPV
ncbi:MAG: GNAT family N-acetyltransferase [Acidobacteria bacterium]|nr:GNAT family N-acetyltransferase [Acidobacteriota bacterium]